LAPQVLLAQLEEAVSELQETLTLFLASTNPSWLVLDGVNWLS
jgi:hypothetical protein